MAKTKKIKVLMAKAGLDGHDRGVLIVSLALRDAGMEVIYTGRHQTPEAIADTAVQEDVNIVGISSLADAHRTLAPKVVNELKKRGRGDIPVILGGFIQPEDIPELKKKGIAEVFSLDVRLDTIVDYIKGKVGAAA
ncbi:MAG: cobalamin B12-binding domain-containing protein [Dehalococcoidales bacterium]|nr:cobalamin B12-binding domain-containing protein [Dehalococcoidales bacterium]